MWKIALTRTEAINPDEVFMVGGVSRVESGLLPYLDYIEVHAPFIYRVYAPILHRIGETSTYVDVFRALHGVLSLVLLVTLFLLVRRLYGARTALWALCILSAFVFFAQRSVHARPDTPALVLLLLALLVLARPGAPSSPGKRSVLAGCILALAFSFHITLLFSVAAVFLWLFLEKPRREGILARNFWAATTAFLLSYGLILFLLFGTQTASALLCHARSFQLDGLYQDVYDPDTLRIFFSILRQSPLPWLLVAGAVLLFNFRWMAGRLTNSYTRLFVLLADGGVVFLLIRENNFEQHYFTLVVFGAVLGALMLREGERRVWGRYGERKAGMLGLLAAALLTVTALAAGFSTYRALQEEEKTEERRAEKAMHALSLHGDSFLDAEAVRAWLRERPFLFDPFGYRTKAQREAQIRFLLKHSDGGEVVFTDWLTPPHRPLPARYHHGFMISLFYRSNRLRGDPATIRFVRRYDPGYQAADGTEAGHMIRLFETAPPKLILLEGSIGRLFTASDRFFRWVDGRYVFLLDRGSGSVFAVSAGSPGKGKVEGKGGPDPARQGAY